MQLKGRSFVQKCPPLTAKGMRFTQKCPPLTTKGNGFTQNDPSSYRSKAPCCRTIFYGNRAAAEVK